MVACAVPSFGGKVPIDNFRPLLAQAHDKLLAHDPIGAGVVLREAVRRFLKAACEYHNCLPSKNKRITPTDYAKVLCKAGVFGGCWIRHAIDVGNRCAHYRIVDSRELEEAIETIYFLADRLPTEGSIFGLREGGAI